LSSANDDHDSALSHDASALAWAEAQVAAARDDPAARLALLARTYHGPAGRAPRHLPFRRAALSFMRWQAQRGVLDPLEASPRGSPWWRTMNERLLRDGCEALALVSGRSGEPSSRAVRLWLEFIASPRPPHWYRAHNASIVGGPNLEHTRIDLTGVPDARVGDEVVIIGRQGDEEITIAEVAKRHGLGLHHVATTVGPRATQ